MTGADGFVGSRLVPALAAGGHRPIAAVHPTAVDVENKFHLASDRVPVVRLEIVDSGAVRAAITPELDAVIHLAAVASGADARKDPGAAWRVNAEGTAIVADAIARLRGDHAGAAPLLLLVSTAEVYGVGPSTPRKETDPTAPCSPYGASKLGAEIAALEAHRRAGIRLIIARSFPHTGPRQTERYVVPALAARIRAAKRVGAPAVRVGNLDVTRELMHVDDVIEAYALLLERGVSGEVYNVASGQAVSLGEVFSMLCDLIGHRAIPEVHPSLMRAGDIPYLVGDGSKLRAATGWEPRRTLEQTLREVVNAQAD
ncbi:MAG: GDP-mannose 4,6-dehydratase [Gemmatimonadetes bacterium]|nr:GDP-mannose 4,6-dehydratase [Gemmatimonadota bacterium]